MGSSLVTTMATSAWVSNPLRRWPPPFVVPSLLPRSTSFLLCVATGVTRSVLPTRSPARSLASAVPSSAVPSRLPVVLASSLPRSPRRCSATLVSTTASPPPVVPLPLVVTREGCVRGCEGHLRVQLPRPLGAGRLAGQEASIPGVHRLPQDCRDQGTSCQDHLLSVLLYAATAFGVKTTWNAKK